MPLYENRLGIFYTCNYNGLMKPLLKSVLKRLKKVSDNKIDIISSVWQPIKNNPFPEYISPYTRVNDINLCLQILSLLSIYGESQKYKYVSFLEHDVFYPDDYFDYPDFSTNVLLNPYSIGLNKFGYINKKKKFKHQIIDEEGMSDMPLFLTTMNFNFAVFHFTKCLFNQLNPINDNKPCFEPIEEFNKKNYTIYKAKNPVLHIDTGWNYSHHFEIFYDKKMNDVYPKHKYWGEAKKYDKFFKQL